MRLAAIFLVKSEFLFAKETFRVYVSELRNSLSAHFKHTLVNCRIIFLYNVKKHFVAYFTKGLVA